MNASQFSDAQKAFILKQGNDGVPVADICRKAGISHATYFNWKQKVRRPSAAGDAVAEASSRMRIVADLSLDREMLHDVTRRKLCGLLVSASWRRRSVTNGAYRSRAHAAFWNLIVPPIITNPVGREQAGLEARTKECRFR
jgi:putative transposase